MRVQVVRKPDVRKIAKNVRFGVAVGLTKTAKDAQSDAIKSIEKEFTTRGRWYAPSNKFGVKITAAKRDKHESAVHTAADWLIPHENGGAKLPRGGRFAVPTDNVRRNKRQIIPKTQRPQGLKGTFVLQTKRGPVLFQRVYANKAGKYTTRKLKTRRGTRLVALYGLERSVQIRRRPTFFEPVRRSVNKNIRTRVREGIAHALATMK